MMMRSCWCFVRSVALSVVEIASLLGPARLVELCRRRDMHPRLWNSRMCLLLMLILIAIASLLGQAMLVGFCGPLGMRLHLTRLMLCLLREWRPVQWTIATTVASP